MSEHTEIVIILDRSGSMNSIKADMENGLNEFVAAQKKEPGECSVTLVQFDNEYEVVFSGKPLQDVDKIRVVPRGWTALLDAVGRTINDVVARRKKTPKPERAKRTLCVIITDGCENSSREFDRAEVKRLVEKRQAKGWEFVYFGANQDAFAEGNKLGIAHTTTFSADADGAHAVSMDMTRGVTSYRRGEGYGS